MLEAHPEVTTPARMREETERQSKRILSFMKRFRGDFEQSGQHNWDRLNGSIGECIDGGNQGG